MRYVQRALALLEEDDERFGGRDYIVTDTYRALPVAGRRPCVVYLQQRCLGLPVYDGRRSVIFNGRRVEVTGKRIPVAAPPRVVPETSAAAAVRAGFRSVFGASCAPIERVSAFAGPERFTTFRGGCLERASAHLGLFAAARTHLAWIVELVDAAGPSVEVVLDASTLRLLRKRMVSQTANACITIPAPEAAGASIVFEPTWTTSAAVRCSYNHDSWEVPAAAAGAICGSKVRDGHALNAFCLINRALDVFSRFLMLPSLQVKVRLFGEAIEDGARAAFAHGDEITLKGVLGTPKRYAALDPSIVIHELSHVVLNAAVGGNAFENPFESEGESRAVSEGLADFLGLTIWNAIRRSMVPPRADREVFGPSFLTKQRDYSAYFDGDGSPLAPSTEPHQRGMALCGALLQARAALVDEHVLEVEAADDALWSAVCRGLPLLPHQGPLPNFCCVRRVVRDAVAPLTLGPAIDDAFDEIGIAGQCPHVLGGQAQSCR